MSDDDQPTGCDWAEDCDCGGEELERDHSCGCGECCDACWFDCCASREGIDIALDMAVDFTEPVTNCGLVPLVQLDFLVNEWMVKKKNG